MLLLIFQSTRGVYDSVIGRLRNVTVNQNLQHLGGILGASIRTFYFNKAKNESANIILLPYKSDTFFIAFFFVNFWQIHVFTFNEYYYPVLLNASVKPRPATPYNKQNSSDAGCFLT